APRLLENLKQIDWSNTTKRMQENWIGRSEGAELSFPIAGVDDAGVKVFTTRPDTVFGATYMVLAPEHPLVARITTPAQQAAVDEYRTTVAATDLVNRKKTEKEKTGVDTGARAVNPATGKEIPIWIADYVLMEYGTGAIMAVPGHDERDFEFATKFGLPIVRVVAGPTDDADTPLAEAYTGPGRLVNSGEFEGAEVQEGKRAIIARLEAEGHG